MQIAEVIGSIVSMTKHESYENKKLLIVQPLTPEGAADGSTMIAVDTIGAGKGDTVLVAQEGRSAMEILNFDHRVPLREIIIGIVDRVDKTFKV